MSERLSMTIRRPDDWHLHLRQGGEMPFYARASAAAGFGRALVMPNTRPPVADAAGLTAYRQRIEAAAPGLEPVMTFKIRPGMTGEDVRALRTAGAAAGKYYPAGATTNSADGLTDWRQAEAALAAMEELDLVFSVHGEVPEGPALTREERFLPVLEEIRRRFPRLRMVMEHVTTRAGAEWVCGAGGRTAATVTAHHLLFSRDRELDPGREPHLFCRPLIKGEADRTALEERILAGDPRFFFGSDSAPHPLEDKEPAGPDRTPAAGVFSAPAALPLLAGFFEKRDKLDLLEDFVSRFGAEFYGMPLNCGTVALERQPGRIPGEIGAARPLCGGETLAWRVCPGD